MDSKSFISQLSRKMGAEPATASALTSALAAVLRERASNLDSIAIPGFGNFVAIKQSEKVVDDEQTGKRMLVPPRIRVEFVASAMLKKQIFHQS